MNLKTAQRLLEYRKNAGFSQEELAEKIGVSRQAVSKWERAEASPDTDNLIALSEVYNITLDELIKGKENKANENVPKTNDFTCEITANNGSKNAHVVLSGVNVEPGVNQVRIDKNGVFVKDQKGNTVYRSGKTLPNGHIFPKNNKTVSNLHSGFKHFPYPILVVIAYLIFGCLNFCGGWAFGWLVFLTIPLYYTLVNAIFNRNASHFAYPVLVLLVYLYLGFYHALWHPMWILFFTVPIYYFLCEFVKKLNEKL